MDALLRTCETSCGFSFLLFSGEQSCCMLAKLLLTATLCCLAAVGLELWCFRTGGIKILHRCHLSSFPVREPNSRLFLVCNTAAGCGDQPDINIEPENRSFITLVLAVPSPFGTLSPVSSVPMESQAYFTTRMSPLGQRSRSERYTAASFETMYVPKAGGSDGPYS